MIVAGRPPPAAHWAGHACHPRLDPKLDPAEAAGSRRAALASASPGGRDLPRCVRLGGRGAARRSPDPAVPAALRRLASLLRIRDLLRNPRPLPRGRAAHRAARWNPARSPRHRLHRPPRRPQRRARPVTPDELTGSPTKPHRWLTMPALDRVSSIYNFELQK